MIPGWTEGVAGVSPGGARLLLIPSELAYGATGTSDGGIAPDEAGLHRGTGFAGGPSSAPPVPDRLHEE